MLRASLNKTFPSFLLNFEYILLMVLVSNLCRIQSADFHIAYLIIQIRKEGNVLFNDALNTFYLRLYGIGHMVKNHSDSERGNLLPPHRLLFPISSKFFYMHHPTDRIPHTTAFVTPVVKHWLEQEIAQWEFKLVQACCLRPNKSHSNFII